MSRVKELVWDRLSANTPFGSYQVDVMRTWSELYGHGSFISKHSDPDEAMLAAQEDYERRILSTLKPEGEQISGEADAWETPLGWQKVPRPYGNPPSEQISGEAERRKLSQAAQVMLTASDLLHERWKSQSKEVSRQLSHHANVLSAMASSPTTQISGEAVERVTEAMVERAQAVFSEHGYTAANEPVLRKALEAAIGGRP